MSRLLLVIRTYLLCCIIFLFFVNNSILAELQLYSLIITVTSTILYFSYYRSFDYNNRRWIAFYPIFVFGYIVVHFQLEILDFSGFKLTYIVDTITWPSLNSRITTLKLSVLGLVFFYLGSTFIFNKPESEGIKRNTRYTLILDIISTISFVLILIFNYKESPGAYFFYIFNLSFTASIIISVSCYSDIENSNNNFVRNYISQFGILKIAILSLHVLYCLYNGDRAWPIFYILLSTSILLHRNFKINIVLVSLLIFLASIVFTGIGAARKSDDYRFSTVISGQEITKGYEEKVPLGSLVELGLSAKALNHAVKYVEEDDGHFFYGYFHLQRLAAVVPGLSTLISNLFLDNQVKYLGSANFITYLVQGDTRYYGDGSSITAELYLDFGSVGICLGMFLFGIFMCNFEQRLVRCSMNQNSLINVSIMMFSANALYLSRSSISFQLTSILLVWLVININNYISRNFVNDK